MNKLEKIRLWLLACGVLFTSVCAHGNETEHSLLIQTTHSKVLETVLNAQEIPGLKSEEFPALRNEIASIWGTLIKEGVLEVSGADKSVRPYFVALQAIVEHVLASQLNKEIKTLRGFIHTPLPATPLCTAGEISKELVDPCIEIDSKRLFTVKARTTIIRDYLAKGGDLYIIYPKDGFNKRTEEQQKIYKQELLNYSGHLFDVPLACENIPADLIGATYLFQDKFGKTYAFAIQMTQAKDPKDNGNFGLWFGPVDHPIIQKRIKILSEAGLLQTRLSRVLATSYT